jgi:predicted Zn-dependent protease
LGRILDSFITVPPGKHFTILIPGLKKVYSMTSSTQHQHFKIALCVLAGLLFCLFSVGSARALTIAEEKKVGRELYDKLEKHGYLERNPRIENYLTELGSRLLAHSNPIFDFRFSVVKNSGVNAFATPGGYVYVFRGLIDLVEKESELAGVLAHEIAHVNARHIASIAARSGKMSIATMAALLAGALFGGGGQATAAIAAMTMATATHMNLQYRREHEEEADRLGMAYLVQSGYDGKAMVDFLKTMRRYEFYSSSIPSYFLTHPGTDERIRYLDGMLQTTYRNQGGGESIVGGLRRVQAILALDGKNLDITRRKYEAELKSDPDDVDALYGLALVQEKTGMLALALENFQKALQRAPDDEDIVRDTGIAYLRAGHAEEAVTLLRRACRLNENSETTLSWLARAHEATGEYASALVVYRKLGTRKIDDVDIYYNMAMTYGRTDHPGESHYYFGRFFKERNRKDSALFHFKAALPYFSKDGGRTKEIEDAIKSLGK